MTKHRARHLSIIVGCAVWALSAVAAYAEEPRPVWQTKDMAKPEPGYMWQVLAVDAAGIAATVVMLRYIDNPVSLAPYLLSGPAMHWIHGRRWQTWTSLGVRAGAPVTLAVAGFMLQASQGCDEGEWFCGLEGAGLGFLTGITGAVVLDLVFARPRESESRRPYAFLPLLSPTKSGGLLAGISGSF